MWFKGTGITVMPDKNGEVYEADKACVVSVHYVCSSSFPDVVDGSRLYRRIRVGAFPKCRRL